MRKVIGILSCSLVLLIGCSNDNGVTEGRALNTEATNTSSDETERELVLGEFTIVEGVNGFPGDQTRTLDIEEAALIGATYILEVFGNDLDGMYLEMTFNYNPHISESLWIGTNAHSPEEFGDETIGFRSGEVTFVIDAFTGERISITNRTLSFSDDWEELGEVTNEELDVMLEIAEDFSRRHFGSSSTIESVEHVRSVPSEFLEFIATDGEGRTIELLIQRETNQLFDISTPFEL